MTIASRIDKLHALMLGVGIVLDGAIWLYLVLRQSALPEVLPIHYNSSGQVDRIGLRQQLFILPVIGLLTLILNGAVTWYVSRQERQLAYVLACVTILVQLLLIGATAQLAH